MQAFHGTTILSVRNDQQVAMGGDGQVSLGDTVMKGNAIKVRKLYQDRVMGGFAGSTADAFTLFEKFEVVEQVSRTISDVATCFFFCENGCCLHSCD